MLKGAMGDIGGLALSAARLTVGAAALVSALVGTAMLVQRASPGLETLANFAPLALAGAFLALVLALGLRMPRVAVVAIIGCIGPAWLMAPEFAAMARVSPRAGDDAPQLRLLAANVWSANENTEAFEALIQREQPDIIVVQEAWGDWKQLLERLAPQYRIHVGCQWDSDCNVVILSKFTCTEIVAPWTSEMTAVRLQLPPRFGADSLEVMGVHLSRPETPAMEREQLTEVASIVRTFGNRAIIAGDFNATPWSRTLIDLDKAIPLERRTRALFSWPTPARRFTRWRLRAPLPMAPIDHLYAGSQWRVIDVHRGPDIGSDHYPIVATLSLAPSQVDNRSRTVARIQRLQADQRARVCAA